MLISPVRSLSRNIVTLLLVNVSALVVAAPAAATAPSAKAGAGAPAQDNRAVVLILGDSLSLCGFGKRLDEHFRQTPELVKSTYTYMACATQPLSWLKTGPYTHIQTHCGFWSIESHDGSGKPKELEDVYGMRRGSTPRSHPVPKLEDLLAQLRPDVLIMQTGGNLFDLFPDKKTTRPERTAGALKTYVVPFITKAAGPSSSLRKFYWVGSPTSGRVSKPVQDFVIQQVRADLGALGVVIDSRELLTYPYRHMEPDHEHFIGEDMDAWADKVFEVIRKDLSSRPLASLKPLRELSPGPAPAEVAVASVSPAPKETPAREMLQVAARLVFKSKSMRVEEFLPYQESMIGYVYDVRRVLHGEYKEKQILVMHPAYIGLKRQSLRKYHIGRTYRLRLRELEGTAWSTVKRRDDAGRIELEPYIQLDDEAKYPGTAR